MDVGGQIGRQVGRHAWLHASAMGIRRTCNRKATVTTKLCSLVYLLEAERSNVMEKGVQGTMCITGR